MIPHNKPTLGKEEIDAAARVIKSGWVAQGSEVKKFEDEFSGFLFKKPGQAAAVSSGTAALYLALISLGIGKGDEVILPTYVCSAVLNAIFMAGARPVLVDIENLNLSYFETVKKVNRRTKAIIITHTFGYPADTRKFLNLGIPIIEDCAQALGSKFNNKYVGTFGDIAIFSFYASKMMTTGYGGMVFSQNKNLIAKIKDYREFDCRRNYKPRFNFQMSDLQAAIGRAQLKKLPFFLKKRQKIAYAYSKNTPEIIFPKKNSLTKPNFFRFILKISNPRRLQNYFLKNKIKTIVPIERYELLHNYLGLPSKNYPVSEEMAKTTLSLPIYPSLSGKQIKYIRAVLYKYFKHDKKI
ncbi:MAG: DegT/DnrJ/EryC1/StrS family aminotransferase [Candidatus Harrisonbacteria bacterium]|nr:DegT/DnrJ/EryC1/StrS family aminotransferase [Candidatus Harrisonbacteria bacterium]